MHNYKNVVKGLSFIIKFSFSDPHSQDSVSLYSIDWPGTFYAKPVGLEVRDPLASVSCMLGLKTCATMPGY